LSSPSYRELFAIIGLFLAKALSGELRSIWVLLIVPCDINPSYSKRLSGHVGSTRMAMNNRASPPAACEFRGNPA
jgi:hypothetical protein